MLSAHSGVSEMSSDSLTKGYCKTLFSTKSNYRNLRQVSAGDSQTTVICIQQGRLHVRSMRSLTQKPLLGHRVPADILVYRGGCGWHACGFSFGQSSWKYTNSCLMSHRSPALNQLWLKSWYSLGKAWMYPMLTHHVLSGCTMLIVYHYIWVQFNWHSSF